MEDRCYIKSGKGAFPVALYTSASSSKRIPAWIPSRLRPTATGAWSDWVSQQLDDAKAGQPQVYDFDAPRLRFFSLFKTPLAADAVEKDISRTVFPRLVAIDLATDEERWTAAARSS